MSSELSDEQWQQIEGAIFAGRKIEAIKRLREFSGLGLKEAKDAVEEHETELRNISPEKFTRPPAKAGCAGMVLVAASLLLLCGCVPTLRAIYTEADLIFEPKLIGTFAQRRVEDFIQPDSKEAWKFTRTAEKSYDLVLSDADGRPGHFRAHLAEVDGVLLIRRRCGTNGA